MNKKLSPNLIALTMDACLKAFWRKRALRTFLKQHRISESFLATWHNDESKRDFINNLFNKLIDQKNNIGHSIILEMARSLAEMKNFPDLDNWEDSTVKISAVQKAVALLQTALNKLDEQIVDEKERERRKKEAADMRLKTVNATQSLEKLEQKIKDLTRKQGTQEGGYAFEKWFYELVTFFEIQARPSYHANERQIDGSLTIDGTTFLVETKFTNKQSDVDDIAAFMQKITRKADNTMGIFLSMSGFSSVAIKEASCDRTPMILMDYSHIYNLILRGIMPLPEVIRRIKRHASQTGQAFLAVENFSG